MVDTGIVFSNMMTYDPWPTVTSQLIRFPTNFMTMIPSLIFTELWVVSIEHLQRLWYASRKCLPFRTPCSVPLFRTCLSSNCWNQMPRNCLVFTRLFTLNTQSQKGWCKYISHPSPLTRIFSIIRGMPDLFGLWIPIPLSTSIKFL